MYTIHAQNVNDALIMGIELIKDRGVNIAPRGLETLECPTPVSTRYEHPCERVLFYPERDANPFFHFFEALWVLAGREDVDFLAQFNSKIADYSDNTLTFHAAYGYRLRYQFGIDQLQRVIKLLKKDDRTRQAVLQIWHCLLDLGTITKDMPCNDLIFLLIRDGKLHMTVCCRSNDMIWGAYGANVVQFSTLLEYLAAMIGVDVGSYTQISNSFHVYTNVEVWSHIKNLTKIVQPYGKDIYHYQLVDDPETFDSELVRFLTDMDDELGEMFGSYIYINSYFTQVAMPIWEAWKLYKLNKDLDSAIHQISECQAPDWRKACTEWIQRRIKKRNQ